MAEVRGRWSQRLVLVFSRFPADQNDPSVLSPETAVKVPIVADAKSSEGQKSATVFACLPQASLRSR
jgi:hypothetical protein